MDRHPLDAHEGVEPSSSGTGMGPKCSTPRVTQDDAHSTWRIDNAEAIDWYNRFVI